jgi:hypothetical protein
MNFLPNLILKNHKIAQLWARYLRLCDEQSVRVVHLDGPLERSRQEAARSAVMIGSQQLRGGREPLVCFDLAVPLHFPSVHKIISRFVFFKQLEDPSSKQFYQFSEILVKC